MTPEEKSKKIQSPGRIIFLFFIFYFYFSPLPWIFLNFSSGIICTDFKK